MTTDVRTGLRYQLASSRKRFGLLIALLLLIGAAVTLGVLFGYKTTSVETAILEIRYGDVSVQTSETGGAWGTATDLMTVEVGDWLWVSEDAAAVLHYFDGSRSLLCGPAQAQLQESHRTSRIIGADENVITTRLVSGQATCQVLDTASHFVVTTPTGAISGRDTVLKADADLGEYVNWSDGARTTLLASLVPHSEGGLAAALIPLEGGTLARVPPLPDGLGDGENENLVKEFRSRAARLLDAAIRERSTSVTVSGAEMLEYNPHTGSAMYSLDAGSSSPTMGHTERPQYIARATDIIEQDDVLDECEVVKASWPVLATPSIPGLAATNVDRRSELPKTPEYQFSIYGVTKPLGVAVHPDGDLIYVSESGGERLVHIYDGQGTPIGTLKPPDSKSVASRSPAYVAVHNSTARIYVSDRTRRCLDVYDCSGAHVGKFVPQSMGEHWAPMAIAFDSHTGNWDDLYVTEFSSGMHRVLVLGYNWDVKLEFGAKGDGPTQFSFPNGVAVDSQGTIYVADSNNFTLKIFDSQGGNPRAIDAGLPRGLAVNDAGLLHVVDVFGHSVIVFEAGETLQRLFTFGGQGMGAGEFNYPNGIAVDRSGGVYIADRENDRVQVWRY